MSATNIKTAYLALGSNLGDRIENMRAAIRLLNADGRCRVTVVSALYETSPIGVLDQPDFLNAVIAVSTTLAPAELLELCMSVEQQLGRKRTIRWGPRVIDIDILLYDSAVVREADLVIPHPRMMERAFVLIPLAEIAPEVTLPGAMKAREAALGADKVGIRRVRDETWSL